MKQLSKFQSVIYHFYPGLLITAVYILLNYIFKNYKYPPQLILLICIMLVALPVFFAHLTKAKKEEEKQNIFQLNGFTNRLPTGKLVLMSVGLVLFAFLVWGATQSLDKIITEKLFGWLPKWYTVQDFEGYSKQIIQLTLLLNLVLNGFVAPFFEELYYRGYLLPRMETWGKWSFVLNALFFSLYHFWQPYIYLTLLIALLPMTYFVYKTKDIRVGILTHCLLNIVGALLSFGLLLKN